MSTVSYALADSATMRRRNVRRTLRYPVAPGVSVGVPIVLLLLLFVFVFGNTMGARLVGRRPAMTTRPPSRPPTDDPTGVVAPVASAVRNRANTPDGGREARAARGRLNDEGAPTGAPSCRESSGGSSYGRRFAFRCAATVIDGGSSATRLSCRLSSPSRARSAGGCGGNATALRLPRCTSSSNAKKMWSRPA